MVAHISSDEQTEPSGDIFRDLEPADRARIEQHIHTATYPAEHVFYTPESHTRHLFLLQAGLVHMYKASTEGRVLKFTVLEPVSIFGEMTLFRQWSHNSFARAQTECTVGSIEHQVMQEVLQTYPQVAGRLMEVMGQRLRDMENKLVEIAFKSVPQRLAKVLLDLSGVPSTFTHPTMPPALIRHTHQQLAEMIGCYRETVTKIVGEFRDQGMIRVEHDLIYLTDMDALQKLVGR